MAVTGWSNSNYLNLIDPLIREWPLSMFGWIKPSSLSSRNTVLSLGRSGTWLNRFMLAVRSDGRVEATTSDDTTENAGLSSNTVTLNQWNAVGGVWRNGFRRWAWCNGVRGTTEMTGRAPYPNQMNNARVGMSVEGSSPVTGPLAEVTLWNVELLDEEMLALSQGVHPLKIRPDMIKAYWPLLGPTHNLILDNTTMVGTVSPTSDHPPVSGPARIF